MVFKAVVLIITVIFLYGLLLNVIGMRSVKNPIPGRAVAKPDSCGV